MSKVTNLLKRIGGYLFSKEKVFPYLRIYRVLGFTFVVDIRNRVKKGAIQKNKVVFWSTTNTYACNPKYIANALLEQGESLDIVWVVDTSSVELADFPEGVRVVSNSKDAVYEISTAGVFVANERTMRWLSRGLEKQYGQIYINTWHGALGIKKTGVDREDFKPIDYKRCDYDSALYDILLSNGTYSTKLYSRIFFNHGKAFETGLPRNDIFFKKSYLKFKKTFDINPETKVVLYAPTWRERGNRSIDAFDAGPVTKALERRFGGRWQLVYRLHHLQKKSVNMNGIDVSGYPDIQEIMAEVDAVITDYSSCIYDFVLTKKPGFIYATDSIDYNNSRGLYYPLEETPFPVAETQSELVKNILNFDNDLYYEKVRLFLLQKGAREDGLASRRVASFIINYLKKDILDFGLLDQANRIF